MILIIHPKTSKTARIILKKMGHYVIDSMQYSCMPSTVLEHPDMQIHPLGEDIAIVPPECYNYYRNALPKRINLIAGEKNLHGTYPKDCAYNVTRIQNYIFCNTKAVDSKLLAWYHKKGFSIIHTNQGYTKCNMVTIGNNTILTEDVGIHNIIIANKLDLSSILIPYGEISLPEFPYGFIGGACGGFGNKLFWYGNPLNCSYFRTIEDVCNEAGIENISLFDGQLQDLGGIICFPM